MIAFIIWLFVGIALIALGIFDCTAKTAVPFGFWSNAKSISVDETDVPKYNKAVGKLWMVYGILLILFGLPLLAGQNSPWIIITILGTMVESILAMAIYVIVIENKYKQR